jgi:hypothetical protein
MRDQGYGQINLGWSGTLVAAYMLWAIMDDGVPAATATLNGVNVVGTWTAFAEPSPCWSPEYIYSFAADVSGAVVHGVNNLTNFPSGVTDGSDPWAAPQVDPMLEGASLVAIYDSGSSTVQQVTVYSGALTEEGSSITESLNYSVTDTSAATTTYIFADGQLPGNEALWGGTVIDANAFPGSDPKETATPWSYGNLWDTKTYAVSVGVGLNSSVAGISSTGDCLSWIGQVVSVGVAVTPPPYPVIFREQGLADGTVWSVTTHATTHSATVSDEVNDIGFSIPNGSYSYSIGPVPGYTTQYSGSYRVAGGPVFIRVIFHAGVIPPPSHTAIYAETNSTSIQTYPLPQIQEFTVGSGSGALPVNFVTLYLSLLAPSKPGMAMTPAAAAGTVVFSLGLLKFGADMLTNTTVPVTYTGWYNVSFPSVNLALGTSYYLSVYQTSGSVQWGYTSVPTVKVNTLSEYFYAGTVLLADTATPDLYSVGDTSATTAGLTFNPSRGAVGSTVTLTGAGFTAGDTVTPIFGGTSEACNEGTVVVASGGSFTCAITVPAVPAGPYSIAASTLSDGTVTAAQTFTVRSAPPTTIYAQTNATSIQTYPLPQIQEFTAGSGAGTVPVNFVTLYLSGSGTVVFSLGSTEFGSDVLADMGVTVTGTGWYNVSFAAVNLALGTNYYLNVYQASGSVQWGYTSAPTVKVNTLTEFYYVGATLFADTMTPDLYSVGYAANPPDLPIPVSNMTAGVGQITVPSLGIMSGRSPYLWTLERSGMGVAGMPSPRGTA